MQSEAISPAPYLPRSVAEHRKRFPAAVAVVIDSNLVDDPDVRRFLETECCFDFDDGLRLCLCRWSYDPEIVVITGSVKPLSVLWHIFEGHEDLLELAKIFADRYREISGCDQYLMVEGFNPEGVFFSQAPAPGRVWTDVPPRRSGDEFVGILAPYSGTRKEGR